MHKGVLLLGLAFLVGGCAAVAPFAPMLSIPHGGGEPLQVHEQTEVRLAEGNFVLVKTNVVGQSKGFSLLGFITIVPATLTKAMNGLYAKAQMHPGEPQTVAHLMVEHSSSYFILFGIPKVEVRADVVQFKPERLRRRVGRAPVSRPLPEEKPPP